MLQGLLPKTSSSQMFFLSLITPTYNIKYKTIFFCRNEAGAETLLEGLAAKDTHSTRLQTKTLISPKFWLEVIKDFE